MILSIVSYAIYKKKYLETTRPVMIDQWEFYGHQYVKLILKPVHGKLPKWEPGAHIVIELKTKQGRIRRPFSISGGNQDYYELLIHADQRGQVTGYILDHLVRGEILYMMPPRGRFFNLKNTSKSQILFLASGVGIAPLLPMLMSKIQQGIKVSLIHTVPLQDNLIRYDALVQLENTNANFTYLPVITQEKTNNSKIIQQRITAILLAQLGFSHFNGDVFLCGSHIFVKSLISYLKQIEVYGNIFQESFAGYKPDPDFKIQVGQQIFKQGKNQTILAACEANNILPFAECRTGHCLNCRAVLHTGKVKSDLPIQAQIGISPILQENMILTCCSVPETDIVLEFK